MRCKVHPFELGPGVCAPCLRERLLALLADGDTCPSPLRPVQQAERALAFPRSVSPYVAHRRSVDDCGGPSRCPRGRRENLFFSTPQIGPSKAAPEVRRKLFPVLSALFRSSAGGGSGGEAPDESSDLGFERNWRDRCYPDESPSVAPERASAPRHGSWFSALIKWRRGKSGSGCGADGRGRRKGRAARGMTSDPEMMEVEQEERQWESPYRSEYSTESFSSPAWRIPWPTPLHQHRDRRRNPAGVSSAVSGFAVCLSPLVRAGPQRQSQVVSGDIPSSGELRPPPAPLPKHAHCRGYSGGSGAGSTAAVLRQNRSRKLADLGRFR